MLKELVEKRKRLHEENVALMKAAKDDGRDVLNADEETEWQSRDSAIDALSTQIARYQKQEAIEARLAEIEPRRVQRSDPEPESEPRNSRVVSRQLQRGQSDMELALRAWFLKPADPSDGGPTEDQMAAAQRIGLDLNSRQVTFNLARRQPRTVAEAREAVPYEKRAQTVTTTGGGYTIPDEMMRSFEAALLFFGGMRQASTVIRTETGADLPFPTANDTGNKGARLDINAQVSNQDVTFGQMVLKAWKYSSKQVLVPVELMQDNAINLPAVLGEMLGERIGRIQNEEFTTGAGTTLPWGLVTRSTLGVTGAAGGGITYANLVDLEHSVDIAYRRMGAAWMMNDTKVATLKKIVDGQSRPIWMPTADASMAGFVAGGSAGSPGTLLGYPVIVNNDMTTAVTTGSRGVIFGALQKYMIRDVVSVTLLRLDERYADFHQVAFLAFARADGDLLNAGTNPVKHFVHTT